MSPDLALAFEQIALPSWWNATVEDGGRSRALPEVEERKRKLIEFINGAGRRVSTHEAAEHVSASYHQCISSLRDLANRGQIRSVEGATGRAIYWVRA